MQTRSTEIAPAASKEHGGNVRISLVSNSTALIHTHHHQKLPLNHSVPPFKQRISPTSNHLQGSIPFVGWMMGHRVRIPGCCTGFNSLGWSVDMGHRVRFPQLAGLGWGRLVVTVTPGIPGISPKNHPTLRGQDTRHQTKVG